MSIYKYILIGVIYMTANKGFTLVELIVVLVILAILAAILVPTLLGYIDRAKESEILINANTFYKAAQATASEYYGIEGKTADGDTAKNGYWLTVTNDLQDTNINYMKHCYNLMDAANMPKFYAVAVVGQSRKGKADYVTYYDVEKKKVAYWDAVNTTWEIEDLAEKPSSSNWNHVYCKPNFKTGGERFGYYWNVKSP